MHSALRWWLLLVLAGLTPWLPAQVGCDARFVPGDPAGAPRGETLVLQVFDADGVGPAPAELVAGGAMDDGAASGPVFAYDGARWRPLGTPPGSRCTALGVFNGELVAALITSVSPTRSVVASWNGTRWRALGSVAGQVHCAAVFNGRLVLGGAFTLVDTVLAANVVQWDGTAWSPLGSGIAGTASALAVFGGVLWVGGAITRAGGVAVSNLATWSGTSWAANAAVDGPVRAMAVRLTTSVNSSFLFLGGSFNTVGTLACHNVVSFHQNNGWAALGSFPPGPCEALLVRATSAFAFELVAGPIPYTWNGSSWTQLGPGTVWGAALAVFGGRYVASDYPPETVRVLDATRNWVGLGGPGIDGPVQAVAATANDLVIGGSFSAIGGVIMNGIARGTVGAWQPLGSGVTGGYVRVLAILPGGDVVAGGSFTAAGGVPAERVARWNGSTWTAMGLGLGSVATDTVDALVRLPDGSLVAGGRFQRSGSVVVNNVARWDGAAWTPMGAGFTMSGFTPQVASLAVRPDGELFAGGIFDQSGAAPVLFLARWTGTTWVPLPGEPNAPVRALATLASGELLVGGDFTAVGALPSVYLARWSGTAWTAVPGFTHIPFGYQLQCLVPQPDGGALVSGMPVNATIPRFARCDGQVVTPLPDPGATFAQGTRTSAGEVVLVGDFFRAGNVQSAYVARYVSPCPALADRYGSGCAGSGGANELAATQLPVLGGAFAARATGMPVFGFALAVTGVAAVAIPLASLLPQGLPGCSLLTTPEFLEFAPLAGGSAASRLPIPNSAELIGLVLHHQFLAFELGGGANLVAATGSNGLRVTVGVF